MLTRPPGQRCPRGQHTFNLRESHRPSSQRLQSMGAGLRPTDASHHQRSCCHWRGGHSAGPPSPLSPGGPLLSHPGPPSPLSHPGTPSPLSPGTPSPLTRGPPSPLSARAPFPSLSQGDPLLLSYPGAPLPCTEHQRHQWTMARPFPSHAEMNDLGTGPHWGGEAR